MNMPFGKYQGMPMSEVPQSYLEWCQANLKDLRPPWKAAIEAELDERHNARWGIAATDVLERMKIGDSPDERQMRDKLLAGMAIVRRFCKATIDRSAAPIRIGYVMRTAERN